MKWPFRAYLHCWVGEDWSKDLHDHSGWMVSVGLTGWYDETTETGSRRYTAPWIRAFPATHRHRIATVRVPTWTLCLMPTLQRVSSFYVDGQRFNTQQYQVSEWAQTHRAC